jgi:non-specific serine/threonine protein kinase
MERWHVGDLVVDLGTRQVHRSGRSVALSPKAFELLAMLVEHCPRAVSRQDLQDRLWPDTFVVEKNLTNLVGEIRSALGDDPARPRLIRTVPRFGYACLDGAPADGAPGADGATRNAADPDPYGVGLSEPLTRFVGRAREVAELSAVLPTARLLTLTGAGGSGKTRLALALARLTSDQFPDGVWFVDLSPVRDPEAMGPAVASVLGVRQPQGPLVDAITASLSRRRALLLLDNCEHLVAGCAELARRLLAAAPGLTVVVTSREPLGLGGERVWQVPPLSVPEDGAIAAGTLGTYEAAQLLLDRARSIDPEFSITPATAPAIAEICRRLDGLPLAIELAAARLTVLSIDQIRDRLDDRFHLLAGGDRTSAARQQTLEAAVDWSYELLTPRERLLLRRLAIFARDWTLEAAEEVCADDALARSDVLDVLARLVDKSLVLVSRAPDGGRRNRFLETIRHYARARLAESGETGVIADRHLRWCMLVAEPDASGLAGRDRAWLRRLHDEHENVRAALDWSATAPGGAPLGLALAVGMVQFWTVRGLFAEGQQWLERLLDADPPSEAPVRARALAGLGQLAFFQGDLARARAMLARGAADAREAGDMATVALACGFHALACLESGDLAQGEALAEDGIAAARVVGLSWLEGPSLSFQAYKALGSGDPTRASQLMEEVARRVGDMGITWARAIALSDLALLRVVEGRADDARGFALEAISLFDAIGDRWGIGCALGMVAGAEAVAGRHRRAARLRGAMEGVLERVGAPVQASYQHLIGTPVFAAVQKRLGPKGYARAFDEGRALQLREALAEAARTPRPRATGAGRRAPAFRHRTSAPGH